MLSRLCVQWYPPSVLRCRTLACRNERHAPAAIIDRGDLEIGYFLGDFSLESGQRAAGDWIALAIRPTAVFCASDEMACGFIAEVQRQGVKVPRDVSVVGFDNIDLVAHITPALTTISQPRRAIAETAAKVLVGLLIKVAAAPPDRVLPLEIVVRESTAAPTKNESRAS